MQFFHHLNHFSLFKLEVGKYLQVINVQAKKNIDRAGRKLNEKWEAQYLIVLQGKRLLCLLCYEAVLGDEVQLMLALAHETRS